MTATPPQAAAGVGGQVAPGFEGVREAFTQLLASGQEVGGGFCAHVGGEPVVDLWGGRRARDSERPYGRDTLQILFSATKGVAALCANLLIERGQLALDDPVARHWPEFAAAGKADVPVSALLSHTVGLPTIDARLSLDQVARWDPVCAALAAQAPYWEPGSAYGYHALTFGWLVGELVRRVDGRRIGRFVAEELAGPLGLDLWIGLPEELVGRVAPAETGTSDMVEWPGVDHSSLLVRAGTLNGTFGPMRTWINDAEMYGLELPAANGIADARSLSRLYAAIIGTVEGGPSRPLLSPEVLAAACRPRTSGLDAVFGSVGLPVELSIGGGFWLHSTMFPVGGPRSFGHPGASGAVGFADPEHEVACGYVTNRVSGESGLDRRALALMRALYRALDIDPVGAT